ncbi:hypothetical protein GCM10007158_13500 [Vreelandella hamiltonii]|jgi:hypothetical protein|uniref:Uncharacterized protein n=2 Tax=Halomonadaceae TaxID=28256 RepID=A0A8H9I5B0_9GAMM|nr:hypothetical protein GCM10007157_19970 [Halomonas hamiltonii]GGW53633.1 hypothetical protein GCM10007158_13500 [Halomonas johnsoniae]
MEMEMEMEMEIGMKIGIERALDWPSRHSFGFTPHKHRLLGALLR